jgi:hypothetical protein
MTAKTVNEEPAANVIEALRRVMRDLPAIGKDSKAAPQQGGYAYRGIEAITREVQTLLAKYGVVFVPRVVSHEVREIVVNEKPWTDTYELVEYDVYGPGGKEDKITVGPILAIGRDNSDKGGNKCMTQAFKYALIQTLCISDAKDDSDAGSPEADSRGKVGGGPKAANSKDPADLLRANVVSTATGEGIEPETAKRLLAGWFQGVSASKDLDANQCKSAIEGFQNYGKTLREIDELGTTVVYESMEQFLLVAAEAAGRKDPITSLQELSLDELRGVRDELKLAKAGAK